MNDPLEPEDKPEERENKNPIAESVDDQSSKEAPTDRPNKTGLFFPAVGQGQMSEASEKKWASYGHLLSLIGIPTAGFGYLIAPIIIYLMKKDESPFVDEHTKETLNFSILTTIAVLLATAFAAGSSFVLACFGWLLPAFFVVANLIYCIQGFLAARNGEAYRYPFNFRLVK